MMMVCLAPFPGIFLKRKEKEKEKKRLLINFLQLKHLLAELWDNFQVLTRFTESREWRSLQKPCYYERWLHRESHFLPCDRPAGAWQLFGHAGQRAGFLGTPVGKGNGTVTWTAGDLRKARELNYLVNLCLTIKSLILIIFKTIFQVYKLFLSGPHYHLLFMDIFSLHMIRVFIYTFYKALRLPHFIPLPPHHTYLLTASPQNKKLMSWGMFFVAMAT